MSFVEYHKVLKLRFDGGGNTVTINCNDKGLNL